MLTKIKPPLLARREPFSTIENDHNPIFKQRALNFNFIRLGGLKDIEIMGEKYRKIGTIGAFNQPVLEAEDKSIYMIEGDFLLFINSDFWHFLLIAQQTYAFQQMVDNLIKESPNSLKTAKKIAEELLKLKKEFHDNYRDAFSVNPSFWAANIKAAYVDYALFFPNTVKNPLNNAELFDFSLYTEPEKPIDGLPF